MTNDRRAFLKRSGAALSAVAVSGCVSDSVVRDEVPDSRYLDPSLLRALAAVVLPTDLGEAGREAAVQSFERWAQAYEPVAELNHGYGTSEIRYAPPDPVPAWKAQLEALELEAQKRAGSSYVGLDAAGRRALLERQGLDGGSGIPSPLSAQHIAVALMAHWFGSSDASDRCYGRRIAERTCRGIDTAPAAPEVL